MVITEKEIKAGDKKTSPTKCSVCKEIILGKVFPGTKCFRCFNE